MQSQNNWYPFTLAEPSFLTKIFPHRTHGGGLGLTGTRWWHLYSKTVCLQESEAVAALSTQFCPQKMTSCVKFPLWFTKIFTINVGNPFEGFMVRDVIYFSLALPFFLYILQSAKCNSEPAEVDFGGKAGREETWKKNWKNIHFNYNWEYVWIAKQQMLGYHTLPYGSFIQTEWVTAAVKMWYHGPH